MADFHLDRISPADGLPLRLQKVLNKAFAKIEEAFDQLDDRVTAIELQAVADAAAAAADAANTAAVNAQTAADNITSASALGSSYVSGVTITGTDAGTNVTITISAHTRHYPQPDGTTVDVAVNAGSVTGQPYDTVIFIYYDDASRAGGAVSYQGTTSDSTAAQLGARHTVGSVRTPLAGGAANDGVYVRAPGPDKLDYQP